MKKILMTICVVSLTVILCLTCAACGAFGGGAVGIASIEKTGTEGLVDTYTITMTDGSTSTFTVTNGKDGAIVYYTNDSKETEAEQSQRIMATSALIALADNWENNRLASGMDVKKLSAFVADLCPNDTASFGISNTGYWDKKPDNITSGTFYIYFHNDDCGKYYGRLKVVNGVFDKKQVTTLEEAPSDWKDYPKA